MIAGALLGAPAASATLPGRDGAIAFESRVEGEDAGPGGGPPTFKPTTYSIFRVQPSGTKQKRLSACGTRAEPECFDVSPAWSPHGTRVAFNRGGELWTMKADGSDARSLGIRGGEPVWAPDGKRLAFVDQDERLAVVRTDGTGLKRLTPKADAVGAPAWSSRNLIAFHRFTDGDRNDLMTVKPDGSARRRILRNCVCSKPDFSPRGDRIMYGWHLDAPGIHVIDTAGRKHRQIISRGRDAVWSPSGRYIAFARGPELYIARSDGSRAHRIAYDVKRRLGNDIAGGYSSPAWQPLPR